MSVEYGLANVPFWAFPLTDDGWKELDERPLFRAFEYFSNNCPDSEWWSLFYHTEDVAYIMERLRERGKVYRMTLVDRNNFLRFAGESDDELRMRIIHSVKVGAVDTIALALDAINRMREIIGETEWMVWNGAEGKDSLGEHHFDWDLGRPSRSLELPENLFEALLLRSGVANVTGDFRHRYWARNPDGSIYRHYHSTLAPVGFPRTKIYSETGVHANLGNTVESLDRQFRALSRHADEWWWHGVIHLNAAEKNPVNAWSHSTLGALEYPVERKEYFGLLAAEGVEEWLVQKSSEGGKAS